MQLPEQHSDVESRIKIPVALAVLLLVGFTASSIDSGPELMSGEPRVESLDRAQNQKLAASGDSEGRGSATGRKIVTTYRMTLRVSNVDAAMQNIESEVGTRGGFVESSSRSQDRENSRSLTVSIPANISGVYENDLESRYDVKSSDVDREEVTDSYSELEAEIESLETEYQRLNELINQTDDVDTLIQLQERLSTVRSRLNYNQQRLDRLQEDIEYSTFHITLEGPQSFESRFDIHETFSDAYTAVFDSFRFMILGAAYIVPFALIYGVYRAAIRLRERGF
jgi:hypothetical protein